MTSTAPCAAPRGDAEAGYALAATAVLLLQRWGGERGLAPLIANLPHAESFDAALRAHLSRHGR